MSIEWMDFDKVDSRVGTIISALELKEARKPAYILHIDMGAIGIKKSSAQITDHYNLDSFMGKQVVCVLNFNPKQIGPLISEVLVTGFKNKLEHVILTTVESEVPNGQCIF